MKYGIKNCDVKLETNDKNLKRLVRAWIQGVPIFIKVK